MYFQYPALHHGALAFVSRDTLWISNGATPRMLLPQPMPGLMNPRFSPDGQTLAFVSDKDLYRISIDGGLPERLTFYGSGVELLGWKDDQTLWVLTSANGNTLRGYTLAHLDIQTGQLHQHPIGPCEGSSFAQNGQGHVIQRQGYGYISWKRYQGGTAGQLWIDGDGSGCFQRLLSDITHNLLSPLWINDRIYFLSDKDGTGQIYSCTTTGTDVRQHTHHQDFYPRQLSSHGHRLTYSCGGNIWTYDTTTGENLLVPLTLNLGAQSKARQVKSPQKHLTSYALSADGKRLALITRGRLFDLTPAKGPAEQKGMMDGVRYRWATWFKDGTLVTLHDQGLEDVFEFYAKNSVTPVTYKPPQNQGKDGVWGRINGAAAHPTLPTLVCVNHRHELVLIQWGDTTTLDNVQTTVINRSTHGAVQGYQWSPCGRWIAYSLQSHLRGNSIWIYDTTEGTNHHITDDCFSNTHPVFDPDGKYLFFLSTRHFDPKRDALGMAMACSAGVQPFVFILQKNQESPFVLPLLHDPESDEDKSDGEKSASAVTGDGAKKAEESTEKDGPKVVKPVVIDFDHPEVRILAFPLEARDYTSLFALKDQLLYTIEDQDGKSDLYCYDLKQLKEDNWLHDIDSFTVSSDQQWMSYTTNKKLRTVRAGSKPSDDSDASFHKGGWLDWQRVALTISPQKEWIHMFQEAWHLQKELFWMPSMGKIDWNGIYDRYRPCIDRVACLSELYSVIHDMHGELGTSHAYVMPAEKINTMASLGSLGAELVYDQTHQAYRIHELLQTDSWTPLPLQRPGLGIAVGDLVWAIAGQPLSSDIRPQHVLMHQAGNCVPVVVSRGDGTEKRTVMVFPDSAAKEPQWRYRQWVEHNRAWVHQHSQGKVGYIHLPDMQTDGYSEFLRGYTQEFDRDGLIVDARYNGGGNVSYFMIDVLRRKRLGVDRSRYHGHIPYPSDAPRGPMVALVNEYTGSDGDIFAHAFKTLGMGTIIGKRTWGGVVGIWPRFPLIDGTRTSQPEFSFWFKDAGWSVENQGVFPDIEVDITPQDYAQKMDPQLMRGLEDVLASIENDAQRQKDLMPAADSEPVLKAPAVRPPDAFGS
jgi:tricorn protease